MGESEKKLVIEFLADSVTIYGPKSNGEFTVKFTTGEYEKLNLAKLMAISESNIIKVKVEPEHEVN